MIITENNCVHVKNVLQTFTKRDGVKEGDVNDCAEDAEEKADLHPSFTANTFRLMGLMP